MARRPRRNRKTNGSTNGTATETAPPIADGLPPDEVFQRHLLKIRPAVGKLKKIVESARRQRAVVSDLYQKADDDGCNRKGFKAALALVDKPADEVSIEQRTVGRILKLIEHPLVMDHGLFPDLPLAPKPPSAYAAGRKVGLAGTLDENPHIPGTEDFVEWRDGQASGQRDNIEKFRSASAPNVEA
jgi:hypothetical protein